MTDNSTGSITVELPECDGCNSKIIITDLTGKIVYLQTFNKTNNNVILPNLPVGIYVAKIISDGSTYIQKLIISNDK